MVREQLVRAIAGGLSDTLEQFRARTIEPARAVHDARKTIKRLRALLGLLRYDLGQTAFREGDRSLRAAGRALAPLREPSSQLESWDTLSAACSLDSMADVRAVLLVRCAMVLVPDGTERAIRHVTATLGDVQTRLTGWPASADAASNISKGFRRTYAKACRAFRRARKGPTDNALHALRRWSKRHQYQLQFFEQQIKAKSEHRSQVEGLSESLGEHHDLAVLRQSLERNARERSVRPKLSLDGLIAARQRELCDQCLAAAEKVFAERPRPAERRLLGPARVTHRFTPRVTKPCPS